MRFAAVVGGSIILRYKSRMVTRMFHDGYFVRTGGSLRQAITGGGLATAISSAMFLEQGRWSRRLALEHRMGREGDGGYRQYAVGCNQRSGCDRDDRLDQSATAENISSMTALDS